MAKSKGETAAPITIQGHLQSPTAGSSTQLQSIAIEMPTDAKHTTSQTHPATTAPPKNPIEYATAHRMNEPSIAAVILTQTCFMRLKMPKPYGTVGYPPARRLQQSRAWSAT